MYMKLRDRKRNTDDWWTLIMPVYANLCSCPTSPHLTLDICSTCVVGSRCTDHLRYLCRQDLRFYQTSPCLLTRAHTSESLPPSSPVRSIYANKLARLLRSYSPSAYHQSGLISIVPNLRPAWRLTWNRTTRRWMIWRITLSRDSERRSRFHPSLPKMLEDRT